MKMNKRSSLWEFLTGCVCRDCGVPYEALGLDIVLSNDQWLMICTDVGDILCGSCIAKRAEKLPHAVAIKAYVKSAPGRVYMVALRLFGRTRLWPRLGFMSW